MLMPETAVDENHLALGSENQVGTARQRLQVETVSVAEAMGQATHPPLRLSVLTLTAAHNCASC